MRNFFTALVLFSGIMALSCNDPIEVDVIFYNGTIYTVDDQFSVAEAMAIRRGKIVSVGPYQDVKKYTSKIRIDLNGKPVYPGFIDPHCHFIGYGLDLKKISLVGTTSFDAIVDTLKKYKDKRNSGWIFGRGWDQNDWLDNSYPNKDELDKLFPDVPVFLYRIDGHAALVNQYLLDMAGYTVETEFKNGEALVKDGELTGLLIDEPKDEILNLLPKPSSAVLTSALMDAQFNCLNVGLTTVCDAGISPREVMIIDSLQKADELYMRMYAMITMDDDNIDFFRKKGKILTDRLNVRSFKLYVDGALGSRGACLLEPYTDREDHYGFMIHDRSHLTAMAERAKDMDFQLNMHCIGDSAVREALKISNEVLNGKDRRWRIEHCQTVNPADMELFGEYKIIPSVQPTHATSDMYWAAERLGKERIGHAYAYKELLDSYGMIANGSDFPIEDINPLYGFYAAVSRKDLTGFPTSGFQKENALSREEALRAMTIWAAYASFEEDQKGSLEVGKVADFVVLESDLLHMPESEIPKCKVLATYIDGTQVH